MTMLETIIREFPVSDVATKKSMPTSRSTYTKEEVDNLIAEALAEARRIDEESMAKHNRYNSTVASFILERVFVLGLVLLYL